jgi:hypothetical protein
MFHKLILKNEECKNVFQTLLDSCQWEDITKGRKGANLTIHDEKDENFIVRTTTPYSLPNQKLTPIHHHLIDQITQAFPASISPLGFNNILIEQYNNQYCQMGYHSDQALDLEELSYICIYSCYSDPETKNIRTLRVKQKCEMNATPFDISLEHNSVVLFSTDTNSQYLHKIILEGASHNDDIWLGLTFRKSKTCIYFQDNCPFFQHNNAPLVLADKKQREEFYKQRKLENTSAQHRWPCETASDTRRATYDISYTVSPGDLMNPEVISS